jgi:hypothetical protein
MPNNRIFYVCKNGKYDFDLQQIKNCFKRYKKVTHLQHENFGKIRVYEFVRYSKSQLYANFEVGKEKEKKTHWLFIYITNDNLTCIITQIGHINLTTEKLKNLLGSDTFIEEFEQNCLLNTEPEDLLSKLYGVNNYDAICIVDKYVKDNKIVYYNRPIDELFSEYFDEGIANMLPEYDETKYPTETDWNKFIADEKTIINGDRKLTNNIELYDSYIPAKQMLLHTKRNDGNFNKVLIQTALSAILTAKIKDENAMQKLRQYNPDFSTEKCTYVIVILQTQKHRNSPDKYKLLTNNNWHALRYHLPIFSSLGIRLKIVIKREVSLRV